MAAIHIGIDFGTTHSGYAFTHLDDVTDVHSNSEWVDQPQKYCKDRTATLYKKIDGKWTPQAFGYNAWAINLKRISDKSNEDYYFAERFKLLLDPASAQKMPLPAGLTSQMLIADYLAYMKKMVMEQLRTEFGQTNNIRIGWALTVPAMWSVKAKYEMRIAAYRAGLIEAENSKDLVIVPEPEAAAVFCSSKAGKQYNEGDLVTICDAGGGTVDITTYKALKDNRLAEFCPRGGAFAGSTYVDENFKKVFIEEMGPENIERAKKKKPALIEKIMKDWEAFKRQFKGTPEEVAQEIFCQIEIPRPLQAERENSGAADGDAESWNISGAMMKDFFDQTIDILKTDLQLHIEEGQSKPNYSEFKKHVILFVGGFAQSDYLKQELRELAKLLRLPLVIPPNPSEAIVIGAAMLSSSPGKIDERCMVTSYGTPVQAIYDPTIHSKVAHLKKQRYDGEWVIDNTFSAFVREGQMVKFDECVKKSFFPIRQGQKSVTLKIYSNDSDKGIVLDKKCHYICETTLYFPEQFINDDPGKNKITLSISFGQSEMVITCIHERSGTSCEVKANYGE